MAPPRIACETLATVEATWDSINKAYKQIKSILKKIAVFKFKLKFGGADIADFLSSNLIDALGTISAAVSSSILGAISNASALILEAIFASILKIILAFPTAIFSLVAIPQKRALYYVTQERLYLTRANSNLRDILNIIIKWTKSVQGPSTFDQMNKALPFINKAIQLCEALVRELDGPPARPGEPPQSYFDEQKFNALHSNLQSAINLTKPSFGFDQQLNLTRNIQIDADRIYNQNIVSVNAEYKRRKAEITQNYTSKISSSQQSHSALNAISQSIKQDEIKNTYEVQMASLESWYTVHKAGVRSEAQIKAATNGSNYVKAIGGVAAEFSYDINRMSHSLSDFLKNMKNGYVANIQSQTMSNAVYNSKALISALISECLFLIRQSSHATAELAILGIESAQSLIEITRDKFTDATDRFKSPDKSISDAELSIADNIGYQLLISADAAIDSTITKSLIDTINSASLLQDSSGRYDAYIQTIAAIPDWDGTRGVWAVRISDASPAPYISIVAKATTMISKIPALVTSRSEKDKASIASLVKNIDLLYQNALRHNAEVERALSSYTPYMGSELGNLMKLLSNAGVLDDFATAMSIANISSQLIANIFNGGFNNVIPNDKNCKEAYPDLTFSSDAAVMNRSNTPSAFAGTDKQSALEDNAADLLGVHELIRTTNFNSGVTDKDLLNNDADLG